MVRYNKEIVHINQIHMHMRMHVKTTTTAFSLSPLFLHARAHTQKTSLQEVYAFLLLPFDHLLTKHQQHISANEVKILAPYYATVTWAQVRFVSFLPSRTSYSILSATRPALLVCAG